MLVASVVLLALAVAGAVLRPGGIPGWTAPVVAAGVEIAAGIISPAGAATALGPLAPALGFLLAAVPLAVLLDGLGFFESLAGLVSRGRHMVGWAWVLGALVTAVLNLDAAVVLLTPLYIRIARRTGISPLTLAFQPVLLAMLASSALPVSNLTNLIAVGHTGASPVDFLVNLGPPSLVATAAGYWCYRRVLRPGIPSPVQVVESEARPLVVGGVVVAGVLVGFLAGPGYGVAPWMVATGADLVLILLGTPYAHKWPAVGPPGSGSLRAGVFAIPWGTALLAAGLAVLASTVSTRLPVASLIHGSGPAALARTVGIASLAANGVNNLPAVLVAIPALPAHATSALWAVLLGVNMGPVVLATGALASLLWLETLGKMGVGATARDFSRVGVRVGLVPLVLATGVLIGLAQLIGH
ncbi:MAG: SLC13 family permease [Acidimicrobiales bacterium]